MTPAPVKSGAAPGSLIVEALPQVVTSRRQPVEGSPGDPRRTSSFGTRVDSGFWRDRNC